MYKYVNRYVYKRVYISILAYCGDDSDIKGYDRRKSELSNALLHMKKDTLHQYRLITPSVEVSTLHQYRLITSITP
tara:strand:- start:139 stop:366 length:228 start_codon:yes stop_codon:yes gene_type:complete